MNKCILCFISILICLCSSFSFAHEVSFHTIIKNQSKNNYILTDKTITEGVYYDAINNLPAQKTTCEPIRAHQILAKKLHRSPVGTFTYQNEQDKSFCKFKFDADGAHLVNNNPHCFVSSNDKLISWWGRWAWVFSVIARITITA